MRKLGKRWVISVLIIVLIVSLSRSPELISAAFEVPSDLNVGPYVDKIVYIPIADSDLRILAL